MNRLIIPFGIFVLLIVSSSLSPSVKAQDELYDPTAIPSWHFQKGCEFLSNLYNPALHLVSEYPTSHTYWISSDNLLAMNVLKKVCTPYPSTAMLSQSINDSIHYCCGTGYDRMHEAILNVSIPTVIRTTNTYVIANSSIGKLFNSVTAQQAGGNYTVLWEVHNGTGILHDTDYADVAAYNATNLENNGNHIVALRDINILGQTNDRTGMVDKAYNVSTGYQAFKQSLYLIALARTHSQVQWWVESHVIGQQDNNGGFYTAYNWQGFWFPGSKQNAETTSIGLLAMAAFPPVPSAIIFSPVTCSILKQTTDIGAEIINPTGGSEYLNTTAYWNGQKLGVDTLLGMRGSANVHFSKPLVPSPASSYNVTITAGNSTKTTMISGLSLWACQYLSIVLLAAVPTGGSLTLLCLGVKRRLRNKPGALPNT